VEALVVPVSLQGKTALQVTLQDITECQRAEAALTQAQTELEHRMQESAEHTRGEQALRVSEERWQSLRVPLIFVPYAGQTDARGHYYGRSPGYDTYFVQEVVLYAGKVCIPFIPYSMDKLLDSLALSLCCSCSDV